MHNSCRRRKEYEWILFVKSRSEGIIEGIKGFFEGVKRKFEGITEGVKGFFEGVKRNLRE